MARQSSRVRSSLLWLLPLVVLALIGWRLQATPRRLPGGALDAAGRARAAADLRAQEAEFRRQALELFPGDPWSQRDHFAARERELANRLASELKVRVGSVLAAFDQDVKSDRVAGRERGRVAPCMPRPFYE